MFKAALLANAAAIIVSHNHPSGDPSPTLDDLEVTRRLAATGEVLGIPVLDHIIVGDGRYFSFKEGGRL
ncbi:MAG: JAB domain-containing protein [Vicinamibacterales bacterium]